MKYVEVNTQTIPTMVFWKKKIDLRAYYYKEKLIARTLREGKFSNPKKN